MPRSCMALLSWMCREGNLPSRTSNILRHRKTTLIAIINAQIMNISNIFLNFAATKVVKNY